MRYSRILVATAATLAFSLPVGAAEPAKPATQKTAPAKPTPANPAPVKQIHFRDLGGVKGLARRREGHDCLHTGGG